MRIDLSFFVQCRQTQRSASAGSVSRQAPPWLGWGRPRAALVAGSAAGGRGGSAGSAIAPRPRSASGSLSSRRPRVLRPRRRTPPRRARRGARPMAPSRRRPRRLPNRRSRASLSGGRGTPTRPSLPRPRLPPCRSPRCCRSRSRARRRSCRPRSRGDSRARTSTRGAQPLARRFSSPMQVLARQESFFFYLCSCACLARTNQARFLLFVTPPGFWTPSARTWRLACRRRRWRRCGPRSRPCSPRAHL